MVMSIYSAMGITYNMIHLICRNKAWLV